MSGPSVARVWDCKHMLCRLTPCRHCQASSSSPPPKPQLVCRHPPPRCVARTQWRMFGGAPIAHFGGHGNLDGQFVSPREIALAADGSVVYVVDKGNHRIEVRPCRRCASARAGAGGGGAAASADRSTLPPTCCTGSLVLRLTLSLRGAGVHSGWGVRGVHWRGQGVAAAPAEPSLGPYRVLPVPLRVRPSQQLCQGADTHVF